MEYAARKAIKRALDFARLIPRIVEPSENVRRLLTTIESVAFHAVPVRTNPAFNKKKNYCSLHKE